MGVKFAARGLHATLGAFQCGPRDDSKIPNEFRQYYNGSSLSKRLNPSSSASLERYRFFQSEITLLGATSGLDLFPNEGDGVEMPER